MLYSMVSWPWNIRTHRNEITIPKRKRNNAFLVPHSAVVRNRLCWDGWYLRLGGASDAPGEWAGNSGMGTWGPKWQHVRAFSLANAPHVFNDQVDLSSAQQLPLPLSLYLWYLSLSVAGACSWCWLEQTKCSSLFGLFVRPASQTLERINMPTNCDY